MGIRHAREALVGAGATVEIHACHFAENAPDAEWLPEIGKRGWVLITKDKAISRRPIELNAIIAANVRAFVLTKGQQTGPDAAAMLVAVFQRPQAGAVQR
jgi:hypothetical protein